MNSLPQRSKDQKDLLTPLLSAMFPGYARWLEEDKIKHPEAKCYQSQPTTILEHDLELAVGTSLEAQGISVRYQVPCDAGIADIVTPDAIYEIKVTLDDNSLFRALGQISIYRQQINPQAKAYIVGKPSLMEAKRKDAMISSAQALGVEIIFWEL